MNSLRHLRISRRFVDTDFGNPMPSHALPLNSFTMAFRAALKCSTQALLLIGFGTLSLSAMQENGGGENIRIGNMDLDLQASLTQSYDSNIGRSSNDAESDFITQFGLRLSGEVELTEINTLSLSIGAEFRKYWENSEYDTGRNTIILTPETGLELFFQIGNFDFRAYDDFSLLSDPGDTRFINPISGPGFTNVVLYNRIRNRLGVDGIWTINPYWTADAGISRLDMIPLDNEFEDLQRHSYDASAGLTHHVAANLDVYGRFGGSLDTWRTDYQPDSSSWWVGTGASWRPTDFLETEAFVSWTSRSFDSDGLNMDQTSTSDGLAGNIALTHLISPVLQHSISYARSIDLGTVSNGLTNQSIQYQVDYSGFERSNVYFSVIWNEGDESGGIVPEEYDRWAFRAGLGYPLSRQLEFSAFVEHTFRDSNVDRRNFSRDLASITLTYDF
ncbi:MAG TPA: hypothetical protein DCX06_03445 [Opitutae bacterium]|nr:hypothetical protein [Opitutae bacterium]